MGYTPVSQRANNVAGPAPSSGYVPVAQKPAIVTPIPKPPAYQGAIPAGQMGPIAPGYRQLSPGLTEALSKPLPPTSVAGNFPSSILDLAKQTTNDISSSYKTLFNPISSYLKVSQRTGPDSGPVRKVVTAPGAVTAGLFNGIANISKDIYNRTGANDLVAGATTDPNEVFKSERFLNPQSGRDLLFMAGAIIGIDTGSGEAKLPELPEEVSQLAKLFKTSENEDEFLKAFKLLNSTVKEEDALNAFKALKESGVTENSAKTAEQLLADAKAKGLPELPTGVARESSDIPKIENNLAQGATDLSSTETPRQSFPRNIAETAPQIAEEAKLSSPSVNNPFGASISQAHQVSIDKVTQALQDAKPIRAEQEAIYTAERGKRAAKAIDLGSTVAPGEQKFRAQLSQLKGEFPKVDFEGIRSKVSQQDINNLFQAVQDAPHLDFFDKVSAQKGLGKLFGEFGGQVPTEGELKLLRQVFPENFIKTMVDKQSVWTKAKGLFAQIINVPKAIRASFDMSAPFRQGLFLINHPKAFFGNFGEMIKSFASEKYFNEAMAEIRARPSYQMMKDSRLALTDITAGLTNREEQFMSNLAEKIPGIGIGIKASERAYIGFLNNLRADVFDELVQGAIAAGRNPAGDEKLLGGIGDFINTFSGRGNWKNVAGETAGAAINRAGPLTNGLFFSPKLAASRLTILNPYYYIKADPFVRKEALKSLFTVAGAGITALTLASLAGARVGTDPTSADFGKIISGKTRIDIWGGTQQYVRMAAQLISGKYTSTTTGKTTNLGEGYKPVTRLDIISRQLQSKEAPVASFITDLLKGQTYTGQPINAGSEAAQLFTPLIFQDIMDVAKNDPQLLPAAIFGALGGGVQSYTPTPPKSKSKSTLPKLPKLK